MDEIPAWAMEQAREIWNNKGTLEALPRSIARALVAERERAAAIAQNKITRAEKAYLGMCDCGNCDLQMVEDFIAAAIRKGE